MFVLLLILSHFCVGFAAMPGKRSVYAADSNNLTVAQRRRIERDWWYSTAHSGPQKTFIEVETTDAVDIRAMAKAKSLHRSRDEQNGFVSHHGRLASLKAFRSGIIDAPTLSRDTVMYKAGHVAKHGRRRWADTVDEVFPSCEDAKADYDEKFPPLCGREESISPLPESGRKEHHDTTVDPTSLTLQYIQELEHTVASLQALTSDQNNTIAQLQQEIDRLRGKVNKVVESAETSLQEAIDAQEALRVSLNAKLDKKDQDVEHIRIENVVLKAQIEDLRAELALEKEQVGS